MCDLYAWCQISCKMWPVCVMVIFITVSAVSWDTCPVCAMVFSSRVWAVSWNVCPVCIMSNKLEDFTCMCGGHLHHSLSSELQHVSRIRDGTFPPIGGFPLIQRLQRPFLRSVWICWENFRVYVICERFSGSNFASRALFSILILNGSASNCQLQFCLCWPRLRVI